MRECPRTGAYIGAGTYLEGGRSETKASLVWRPEGKERYCEGGLPARPPSSLTDSLPYRATPPVLVDFARRIGNYPRSTTGIAASLSLCLPASIYA